MMETDPQRVEQLAEQREEDNWAFRRFIKWQLDMDDQELDALVAEITDQVREHINCQECGNCCRLRPDLNEEDVERIAAYLGLSRQEFLDQYATTGQDGQLRIARTPCPFLESKRCTIQEVRPLSCRDYPFLYRDGFRSRTIGVISNSFICPIVYNVLEELKGRLGWRLRRW